MNVDLNNYPNEKCENKSSNQTQDSLSNPEIINEQNKLILNHVFLIKHPEPFSLIEMYYESLENGYITLHDILSYIFSSIPIYKPSFHFYLNKLYFHLKSCNMCSSSIINAILGYVFTNDYGRGCGSINKTRNIIQTENKQKDQIELSYRIKNYLISESFSEKLYYALFFKDYLDIVPFNVFISIIRTAFMVLNLEKRVKKVCKLLEVSGYDGTMLVNNGIIKKLIALFDTSAKFGIEENFDIDLKIFDQILDNVDENKSSITSVTTKHRMEPISVEEAIENIIQSAINFYPQGEYTIKPGNLASALQSLDTSEIKLRLDWWIF